MDEFLTYSGHSFRGLIRPDEQALVEKSIWDQIHSKANGTNDYVQFHFVKKDGSCHPVLDHGRIVENTYFGTIFYVLIMDCALLDTLIVYCQVHKPLGEYLYRYSPSFS